MLKVKRSQPTRVLEGKGKAKQRRAKTVKILLVFAALLKRSDHRECDTRAVTFKEKGEINQEQI